MARTVITQITDDIDGSKDASEVAFSFNGVDYTIDLGRKNLAAMEKALKPYLDAATRVSRSQTKAQRRSRGGGAQKSSSTEFAKIRQWARDNGIDVADRGRVPTSVVEQYRAAN